VELSLEEAGDTDDLDRTIDYAHLAARIHDLVAGERWNLIERVAHQVAGLALELPRAEAVRVTVHKPQAPLPVPVGDVAVTIERRRQ
jgi:dihydroneopterin aldolase